MDREAVRVARIVRCAERLVVLLSVLASEPGTHVPPLAPRR